LKPLNLARFDGDQSGEAEADPFDEVPLTAIRRSHNTDIDGMTRFIRKRSGPELARYGMRVIICGADRDDSEDDISFRGKNAIRNFVSGSVAAGGSDGRESFFGGTTCEFRRVARVFRR
jgi:hypothetical protein